MHRMHRPMHYLWGVANTRKHSPQEERRALQRLADGESAPAVAADMSIKLETLLSWKKRKGLPSITGAAQSAGSNLRASRRQTRESTTVDLTDTVKKAIAAMRVHLRKAARQITEVEKDPSQAARAAVLRIQLAGGWGDLAKIGVASGLPKVTDVTESSVSVQQDHRDVLEKAVQMLAGAGRERKDE